MRLGIKDRRVIAAFVRREAAKGHKLSTDGSYLDGHWMGGNGIASWTGATAAHHEIIIFHDLGSRAAQNVQRAIKRQLKKR